MKSKHISYSEPERADPKESEMMKMVADIHHNENYERETASLHIYEV